MKQALKSSGTHCTMKHMEISMCGLLLLDVAKAADNEFHTPYRSSHHIVGSVENEDDHTPIGRKSDKLV